MKMVRGMGLAVLVILSGCGSWGRDSAPVRSPEPGPVAMPAVTAGKWLMVSCYVNASGCRGEAIFDTKQECVRARKDYDRKNKDHRKEVDRQAACKPADEG